MGNEATFTNHDRVTTTMSQGRRGARDRSSVDRMASQQNDCAESIHRLCIQRGGRHPHLEKVLKVQRMTADNDHLAGSVLRIKAPPGKPGQPIQAWLKHKLLPPILPDLESFFCLKLGVFENGAEGEEGGKPLGLRERHRVHVPRHL
jgi:hypothetical protein